VELIFIICSLPIIQTDAVKTPGDFHIVFEDIGYLASSTDYQLATMKVNLTLLEQCVISFQKTVETHMIFVDKVPQTITQRNQTLSTNYLPDLKRKKLMANLKTHNNDAEALVYKVQQIKDVLPQIRPQDQNEIQADYRERRSIFSLLWGIMETYRGIMSERKYEKMRESMEKTTALVNRIVNVVNNQGKAIQSIENELEQIKGLIAYDQLIESLDTETSFRSAHFQLNNEIDRIKTALQCAQWRRLSIDFLSSNQLNSLFTSMVLESQRAGTELLVHQPSDLLQLELSYFYNGEIVTLLLHVPTVPIGSILRLIKLHPFPLPISGNYSIVPDVDTQILALSTSDVEMSLEFPSVNLLGCSSASHVYLCEKVGALNKHLTSTCLGALYKQQFDKARILCPMKIVNSGEILYRLDNNKHLVYTPEGQTIPISCPANTMGRKELFLPQGVSEFQLDPGCKTELVDHFVFSDNSIASDSGLEHITLNNVVSMEIPNISPEALESIMSAMTRDGLYQPTMNDIIEAHEQLEELNLRTSRFTSLIVFIVFAILFIIIIAFLSYLFHYLYTIRKTISTHLKLKTRKSLYIFIISFLQTLNLTQPENQIQPE